jgi:hypothetical protein
VKQKTIELDKIKKDVNLFIGALKKEGIETKTVSKLITSSLVDKRKLTKEEGRLVVSQLKNISKTLGLATIFLMPGGSVFFILIHYLGVRDYFLSDSFEYLKNKDI